MPHIVAREVLRLTLVAVAVAVFSSCAIRNEEDDIPEGVFIDSAEFDDTFVGFLPDAGELKGKTWLVIGDSISTRGLIESNYEQYVSEWLDCEVINVAAGGTGYIQPTAYSQSWLDSVDSYPDAKNVNFITVMGALNDASHALGDDADIDVDASTFYGALDSFYRKLKDKYPGVPIGVITSTPRSYCHGEDGTYIGFINAVSKIAGRFSLPLLDLYRMEEFKPWTNAINKKYFVAYHHYPDGDGIHPNTWGHFEMAKLIYPFIVQNCR
ncbi:MAG TPA: SGNH/GDSL hydrolase family protein [Rectinemataceae bacterium]|nr:SGNH/GDSL hydrolase family protein [Rectinemataceae bacterium]